MMENVYSLELITSQTSVPNLLLDHYKDMGLNETELVFLIVLLRLKAKKDVLTPRIVARESAFTETAVFELIMPLVEKGFLTYNGTVIRVETLMNHLIEVRQWLEVKTEQNLKKEKKGRKEDGGYAELYQCFEKEMGRPLSPMEGEQITYWYRTLEIPAELIKEALRRSVMRSVFSFRYIESILLSWQKLNIRSLQDLQQYDKNREQQLAASKKRMNGFAGFSAVTDVSPHRGNRSFRGEQDEVSSDDFFEV